MYLREGAGTRTLADVREQVAEERGLLETTTIGTEALRFEFDQPEPVIVLGDAEVPASTEGIVAFGNWLGVPTPFLKRLGATHGPRGQKVILDMMMQANPSQALTATYTPASVKGVYEANKAPLDPLRLVDLAGRVTGTDGAYVERLVSTMEEFSLDVRVPEDYSRGVGGDRQVGDITAGGFRVGVDLKRGLAPWVQPWMFRLRCTNGQGWQDEGLRVDARGQTVDEVLAELEAKANIAFSRVEAQIEHFYRMREERVANPERAIIRIAEEQDIPNRSLNRLLHLAAGPDLPDNPTMFDVINLVTNLANDPAMRNDGGRLLLENAGGNVVADAAARCGHCQSRLG